MKLIAYKSFFHLLLMVTIVFPQAVPDVPLCSRAKLSPRGITLPKMATVNQGKLDMVYYKLNLTIDPVSETISGQVSARAIVLDSTFSTFDLDLSTNLSVDSVTYSENTVNFSHTNDLLEIQIPGTRYFGEMIEAHVNYHGHPVPSGFGSFKFDYHDDKPMIWSLSEPYGARNWWPCKDAPNDKADSVDISITVPIVPDSLIVASNGLLKNIEVSGDWATYHWESRYPIATYLVSIAIYPYTVFHDWFVYNDNDSMRLDYYVYPDHYEYTLLRNNYALTKDMLTSFSERFGLYPFIDEKYGHAEFRWGGGMEHQTLTSLGGYSQRLIAHELAHQWWGDMITCENFHHIWLNEGFATYSQAMWSEMRDNTIQSLHNEMANKTYYGDGTIYVEDTTSVGNIFNGNLSYNKAAWVLHMLRHIVGDSTFFHILRTYGSNTNFRFGTVTTEEFRDLCEDISGIDLRAFFNQWIYGSYYPIYDVWYSQYNDNLQLTIDQSSIGGTEFHMPIDVSITCSDTTLIHVIQNSQSHQEYWIPLPEGSTVSNLRLDPNNWILKQVRYMTVGPDGLPLPRVFHLYPVYPNPFNKVAHIAYVVPENGDISIEIIDLMGRVVWSVYRNSNSGYHTLTWDGKDRYQQDVSSGVYFIHSRFKYRSLTQKIILLK